MRLSRKQSAFSRSCGKTKGKIHRNFD
jgi:hypothetical protein